MHREDIFKYFAVFLRQFSSLVGCIIIASGEQGGRATVIYADSLLLVNFSMDFLALYITFKLSHITICPGRMSVACILGAIWALMIALLEPYTTSSLWQIVILVGAVLCAAVMISTAAGKRTVLPMLTLSYIAVSVGLGGAMTAMYSFINRAANISERTQSFDGADMSPLMFIIAALAAGAVSLIYGKVRENRMSREHIELTLWVHQKNVTLELLADSGNLLRDPISQNPVIIISAAKLYGILPKSLIDAAKEPGRIIEVPDEMMLGARFVPLKSVTGQGIMLCFRPDRLSVEEKDIDALVGIDVNSREYDGCDGIIPQILLNI